jgi:hypothetical protein
MALEEGSVSGVVSVEVKTSVFQVIADTVHLWPVPVDIWFLSYRQHRCGCRCRNGQSNLSYYSACKNGSSDLFAFSVSNSETDGWICMLIAHGNAPFVFGGGSR